MARRRRMSILTAVFWLSLEMSYFPSKSHALHSGREVWGAQDASGKRGPMMGSGSQGPYIFVRGLMHSL